MPGLDSIVEDLYSNPMKQGRKFFTEMPDGTALSSEVCSSENPERVVLNLHGAGESKEYFTKERTTYRDYFLPKGNMMIYVTMRSHFDSGGVGLNIEKSVDDTRYMLEAIDMGMKNTDINKIVLLGCSLGGYISLETLIKDLPDTVKSAISLSTPFDLYEGLKTRRVYYRKLFDIYENWRNEPGSKINKKLWKSAEKLILQDHGEYMTFKDKLRVNSGGETIEELKKCNVKRFVKDIKRPCLIVNSIDDHRVPNNYDEILDANELLDVFLIHGSKSFPGLMHLQKYINSGRIQMRKIYAEKRVDHELSGVDPHVVQIIENWKHY